MGSHPADVVGGALLPRVPPLDPRPGLSRRRRALRPAPPRAPHPRLSGRRLDAAHALNAVRYHHDASVEMRFLRDLRAAPRVPTTSIYSRSDGVVNWKACLRTDINAIEVHGSHVGLALNPEVYRILAHLLPAPWRHN